MVTTEGHGVHHDATLLVKWHTSGATRDNWKGSTACIQSVLLSGRGSTEVYVIGRIWSSRQARRCSARLRVYVATPLWGVVSALRSKAIRMLPLSHDCAAAAPPLPARDRRRTRMPDSWAAVRRSSRKDREGTRRSDSRRGRGARPTAWRLACH